MLPSKLHEIQQRLRKKGPTAITGEKPLLEELDKLDALLEKVNKPQSLDEGAIANREMLRQIMAITSGPGEYCSACGRKL